MKAFICRRSASGMVHHGRRRVAQLVFVDRASNVGCGSAMYMTQWVGRGTIPPISTRSVCGGGSVSKRVTANLAAASARSLPLILVWALILWRVVRSPADRLVSIRLVMLPSKRLWW